jgi:iron complex transport system ATP-binding protein
MALSADSIRFGYRQGVPVLEGVSAAFPIGSVTALVGPNGAGKTTLLRLLAGLTRPWEGRVEIEGVDPASMPAPLRARQIAYVQQTAEVAFPFTVREVVALGRFSTGPDDHAIRRALEMMDVADRADDPFGVLSAGQRQRVTLARALAQLDHPGAATRCLLADEPVSAMDPRHALHTMGRIRALAAGPHAAAVIIVLHDLTLASRFADRCVVLDESGGVAAQGEAPKVLSPEVLEPVFCVRFETLISPDGAIRALVPCETDRL